MMSLECCYCCGLFYYYVLLIVSHFVVRCDASFTSTFAYKTFTRHRFYCQRTREPQLTTPIVSSFRLRQSIAGNAYANESNLKIDFQSDQSSFGRGEMHLSALLQERDVVVYQTGTWEVDGVEVGDGNPPSYAYCVVETLQIVWTHNCEHGFISGLAVTIGEDDDNENDEQSSVCREKVRVVSPLEFVDFGPEQLVARIPVNWINDNEAELLVKMPKELSSFEIE